MLQENILPEYSGYCRRIKKMNKIKNTIIYTMVTTGTSLVILTAFLIIIAKENIDNYTVLQIFAANIVINTGVVLMQKFESRYVILEYILDVSYIIAVLVIFGVVFNWYSSVPVWLLVVMAIAIYIFMLILTAFKIKKDTKKINELLQKRRYSSIKNGDSAS
jgi:hypothetical protein